MCWETERRRLIVAVLFAQTLAAPLALAEPYRPASDELIVERLPRTDARARRSHGAPDVPRDLASALAAAAADLETARTSGDPRYLGHAQAALRRWWNERAPPSEAALLRAQIKQHDHDFDAALADLHYVISRDPRNAQAYLTRAAIHLVQGRYAAADMDCRRIALLAPPLTTAECVSRVASHRGQARAAYDRLLALRDRVSDAKRAQAREIELTLADIATRLGAPRAGRHYLAALSIDADSYALSAYADWLLDQREFQAVIALFQQHAQHPDLLLRAALAARAAGGVDAQTLATRLRRQYAAHRQRGDFAPSRDYARLLLEIENDANAALDAALAVWRSQREPADARVVLQAALASGRVDAVQHVIAFIESSGLEDVRLTGLIAQLRSLTRTEVAL